MGLFRKIIQRLTIDFHNKTEASIRFENLIAQAPADTPINFYFLSFYAKMLYNLGPGPDSQALHLYISDIAGSALYDKVKIDESLKSVEYRGKGEKTYVAEWDKKGAITTKIAWGEEGHYATASVLLFLDHLNQTLPKLSRRKLFYCIYEFQNAVSDFGIPKIRNIIEWSSQIVSEVETNLDEYHKLREESEKEYRANVKNNHKELKKTDLIEDEKFYSIQKNGSEKSGILIIPTEYILKLHPDKAIAELEAYANLLKAALENSKSDSSKSDENIEKMHKIALEIKIAEAFLNDLKQGSTPKLLKYLDFEKDNIDWLTLLPEIIGEEKLDEITRQASKHIREKEDLKNYLESVRINPNDAKAHYNLGVVYIELGKFQDAIKPFIRTIQIEPNNAMAYDNLGSCYLAMGHHQDAIEAFKNAIHIEPDLALAHFNLGRTYNMLEQYEKAIEEYKKTTLIEPNFPEAHALLGANYLLIGDSNSAYKEYEVLKNLDEDLANRLLKEIRMSK